MAEDRVYKKMLLFLSDQNPVWGRLESLENQLGQRLMSYSSTKDLASIRESSGKTARLSRNQAAKANEKIPSPRWVLLDITDTTWDAWRRADSAKNFAFEGSLHSLKALLTKCYEVALSKHASETNPIVDEFIKLRDIVKEYSDDLAHGNRGLRIYKAARLILNIGMSNAQKVLDDLYYRDRPLLPSAFYPTEELATRDFDVVSGFFVGWMHRFGYWMRCSIHVRYPLRASKRWFIRTKLNLPIISPTAEEFSNAKASGIRYPYAEYDGFITISTRRSYWYFDKRSSSRHDYFNIITGGREERYFDGSASNHFSGFVGQYLTSHQDVHQRIVGGAFVIEEADVDDSPAEHGVKTPEAFMWNGPAILKEGADDLQIARAKTLFRALGIGTATMSLGKVWTDAPARARPGQ